MKNVLSVLGALCAALLVIFITEMVSHKLYPEPAGFDIKNKQMVSDYINNLPLGAFMMLILGWFLGAIAAGSTATYLDPENALRRCRVVGAILFAATVFNLIEFPHPIWVWILGLLSILFGVFVGYQWMSKFVAGKN